MPKPERNIIRAPARAREREIALFLAQLDDLSRCQAEDTRGLSRAVLAWQPAPGMNTIGMLMAHAALVEVGWVQAALLGKSPVDYHSALGINREDDGMPLPPGARPPRALAGKTLAFYDRLLERARAHTRRAAATLTDADLDPVRRTRRRNGQTMDLNGRWVFYHLLEHFAGHYGQILLLVHLARARRRGGR